MLPRIHLPRLAWVWLAIVLIAPALFLAGCGQSSTPGPAQQYTCSMHPQVIQNKPGNCPICGMKLTPVRTGRASGGGVSSSDGTEAASGVIQVDPVTVQNMALRTGVVTSGPLRRTVRTVGVVDFDETTLTEVTTKFRGWIVKLHVDTTGQQVHRGQPLFEIYSPELYSAQAEYLLALQQSTNVAGAAAAGLQASALAKLTYFDISAEQIADVRTAGEVKKTLSIHAPRDGVVIEKMAVEGQMVEAGMRLYRLADLGTVWVQSQVYEQDLPLVRLGQETTVSLAYLPDRKFRGRVTYVYPTVDEKTRTVRVRMEFHNPGYFLKPGMFATVELTADLAGSVVLVPDMAVLRSGEKNTVFVALEGGKFEARTVVLGSRGQDDTYQVLSGLRPGERIVTSGQFLLDSESQLREAVQKLSVPAAVPERAGDSETRAAPAKGSASPEESVYLCPMPEHVALEYEHPGKCPLCGMTLVPVTKETLHKIQPGGRLEHYTCPMPEHSDVREIKAGKCPRCGMTLIPVMVQEKAATAAAEPSADPPSVPAQLYTCPMAQHADVVSDKSGTCPKCEMKLVETGSVSHGKVAEEHWRKQHPAPAGSDPSR